MVPGKALVGTCRYRGAVCRGGTCRAARRKEEPARVGEERERWRPRRVLRHHMQGLLLNRIGQCGGDPVFDLTGIGIEPLELRAFTLQRAYRRIGATWVAVDIDRRRVVGVHRE